MRRSFGIVVWLCLALGCSAARTTFVQVDSQGNLCEDSSRCVRGIPAMVKVPTHIEVRIVQTDFWKLESDRIVIVPQATVRDVEVVEVVSNKMIIVDPKRPLSGTGEFGLSYSADGTGTLTSVNYKAIDDTIKSSASLVTSAVKAFGLTATKSATDDPNDKLMSSKRTIALRRFPIDRCSQPEIEDFVGQYVNYCGTADCHSNTQYAR